MDEFLEKAFEHSPYQKGLIIGGLFPIFLYPAVSAFAPEVSAGQGIAMSAVLVPFYASMCASYNMIKNIFQSGKQSKQTRSGKTIETVINEEAAPELG